MVAGIRCQKYATNMEKKILLLYNIIYYIIIDIKT